MVPTLQQLLGGSLATLRQQTVIAEHARAFPLDATLDTGGMPQSGTGQAALLTGADAARIHGGHFGPWTPVKVRPLVEELNVLRRAAAKGARVAFANAYPRWWPGKRGARRIAAVPLAAKSGGFMTRHEDELGAGDAVSSEIVNDGWRRHLGFGELPDVSPEDAGRNLARIAATHDLTFFAHYATDTAGHEQTMEAAVSALRRVDRFLAGVWAALDDDVALLVASDHGNLEDVTQGHTRNPVMGVVAGKGAVPDADGLADIRGVPAFVLGELARR